MSLEDGKQPGDDPVGASGQSASDGAVDVPTDEDLVRAARELADDPRGADAASVLIARYRRRVYLWCFRFVRERERALDLAQDALLSVYRALPTFEGGCPVASWIYVITTNRCRNELRRPALFVPDEVDPDAFAATEVDPAEQLLRKLDEEELLALIHGCLDREEQAVLWLRCIERMPVEAISGVARIEQASGARGVLQRARRKLRAALERREIGGQPAARRGTGEP